MPTPAIQTLRTDAQQVLNLDSISAVRSVVAATLANANAGTPLNPNLTTQQLWNEFYQIITQPKSDIESIIANQLMKFLYAPPAPGGVGANGQVIFNDGGVLAGDPQFLWNKTTNLLTVTGSATISGDLTVDTSTLKVDSTNNRVGIGTASPATILDIQSAGGVFARIQNTTSTADAYLLVKNTTGEGFFGINALGPYIYTASALPIVFTTATFERYRIAGDGVATWSNVGGVAGTAMTLNSTGLGVGVTPSAWSSSYKALQMQSLAFTSDANSFYQSNNAFINSTPAWTYIASKYAVRYDQDAAGGIHKWFNAPSGTAGNAITWTQAMTLDASGNLLVGTTSLISGTAAGSINIAGANSQQIVIRNTDATAGAFWRQAVDSGNTFYVLNNASTGVSITSGATSWSAVSDERLKDIIEPISNAIAKVGSLRSVIGKYKNDETNTRRSFLIAQDVLSVLPEAVDSSKSNELGLRYSELIPLLVAAIKELTAEVNALKNA